MWGGLKIQEVQGFATLLFTMVILMSITAFAFLSAESVVSQQRVVVSTHKGQSAFNIAQAGLDYAIPYLNANYSSITDSSSQRMNMPGGGYATVSFAFIGDRDTIRITSVGHNADDTVTATVHQTAKYNSASAYKTLSQAAIARHGLFMGTGGAVIRDSYSNPVTVLLGTNVAISLLSGKTLLNGVTSSTGKSIGADIVIDPSIFSGKTSTDLQTEYLGRTIAEMAADVPASTFVTKTQGTAATASAIGATIDTAGYTVYSRNTLTGNGVRSSVIINQVGTSAAINGGTYGSSTKPFVLKVNLSGSSAGEAAGSNRPSYLLIQSNAVIYGDVIVQGGDVVIDKGAKIYGNVIAYGSTIQIQNATVNGALISTGTISLFSGATVNGLAYTELDFRTFASSAVLNGGVFSGYDLRIGNTPTIYDPGYPNNSKVKTAATTALGGSINYDPSLARIAVPVGSSSYGRVAGSWSDM